MSEYDHPGCTVGSISVTDPETRPYKAITGYRTAPDYWFDGALPDTGSIVEFRAADRTYRGVVVGYDRYEDGEPRETFVRLIHAPHHCGGGWGNHIRFRVVESPGPRVRTLARGYTGARPRTTNRLSRAIVEGV